MRVILTHNGQDVTLRTTGASCESGRSFRLEWCSRWDLVDELATVGVLRREYRNGHGDPYAQVAEYYYR